MRNFLLAILANLLFSAALLANPSVCAVKMPDGSMGSCTYIGNGLFITNNHVVEGCSRGVVQTLDGVSYPCDVLIASAEDDIAILESDGPVVLPSVRIADRPVRAGEKVTAYGFGASYHDTDPAIDRREWVGYVRGNGKIGGSVSDNAYLFSSPSIPGDSGGGCFNSDGEYIGPLFGTDGRNTYACMNSELHKLLRSIDR